MPPATAIPQTPAMQQFVRMKAEHPDALLFFRMGDFYELFFDDAVVAAKALEIALTSRSKDRDGEPIPMCGVPYHAVASYVGRLVKLGFRVALCEQVEDSVRAASVVRHSIAGLNGDLIKEPRGVRCKLLGLPLEALLLVLAVSQ